MPVTFVDRPAPANALASALMGLNQAYGAFRQYKNEERDYKMKVEDALLKRQESEQMRQMRDLQMAGLRHDQEQKAREEGVRQELERADLGEARQLEKGVSDFGKMVDETTKTGFVDPQTQRGPGITAGAPITPITAGTSAPLASLVAPQQAAAGAAAASPFARTQPGQEAPLARFVAPQIAPQDQTAQARLAADQAAGEAEAAVPTGPLSARESALGRRAGEDRLFRREVGERERQENVTFERQKMIQEASDKRQLEMFKQQNYLAAERERSADERQQKNLQAAWERAELAQTGKSGEIPEDIKKDIDSMPDDWRGVSAEHVNKDDFPTRNQSRASAIAYARQSGKKLIGKKQHEAILAAKSTMADLDQAQKLLADPEVSAWLGRYRGTVTDFLSAGWAGNQQVPPKVAAFRANLNRLSAEERHRMYGSALTDTESKYAEGFIPQITQPPSQIGAALNEFKDDLIRSMDALWGPKRSGGGGTGSANPRDPGGLFADDNKNPGGL